MARKSDLLISGVGDSMDLKQAIKEVFEELSKLSKEEARELIRSYSPPNKCGLCTDDKPCNFENCPNDIN